MKPIVECVPNFSEGRRQNVIDEIVAAMAGVPDARVLDVQSDPDHNRSVVTIVGQPEGVLEAAFQGVLTAAELIEERVYHIGAALALEVGKNRMVAFLMSGVRAQKAWRIEGVSPYFSCTLEEWFDPEQP